MMSCSVRLVAIGLDLAVPGQVKVWELVSVKALVAIKRCLLEIVSGG